MMRGQRRRSGQVLTGRTLLAILALIAMAGSAAYWWGVQSQLTENKIVAAAFTAILVLAPPSLMAFLIPWSPAGMLLQKVNARTWAFPVIIASALYLLYYSYQIQWAWWAAQPVVANAGYIESQVLIGIIGFIIIPALLWTPVSSDELVEQVRQAHLVKRYELQTQADIAILRATLLRAQEKALVGFANLTAAERQELAAVMRGLVGNIDRTLKEVGQTVKTVSGVAVPFDTLLDDNEDVRDMLDYISETLTQNTLELEGAQENQAVAGLPAPEESYEPPPRRYAARESYDVDERDMRIRDRIAERERDLRDRPTRSRRNDDYDRR
jgi:hypothetical protein